MYETVVNCFLMRFMVHNEIHSPLGAGYNSDKVKQGISAQMHFSHTSYSPQISAFTWTIRTWTGPEVYWKYIGSTSEVVNYQRMTMLTHGADSYTKIMSYFCEEGETSVGSCTSKAMEPSPSFPLLAVRSCLYCKRREAAWKRSY